MCLSWKPNRLKLFKARNLRVLLDLGHGVTEAQSGSHALKLLESDSPFDVVVTDCAMPGMNGLELAQRIKERNSKLPVVLAIGYAELPAHRSIEFERLSKPYATKDFGCGTGKGC
jgi:CheY-like chemotaxis protein